MICVLEKMYILDPGYMRKQFKEWDRNGDWLLSYYEWVTAMVDLGVKDGWKHGNGTRGTWKMQFKAADKNRDGYVGYEELMNYLISGGYRE